MKYTEPITPPALSGTLRGTNSRRIYTDLHVRKMLWNLVRREGSQEKAAQRIGVSKAFISQVLRGGKQPGEKISIYFGLERHVVYTLTPGRHEQAVNELNKELETKYDSSVKGYLDSSIPTNGGGSVESEPRGDADTGEQQLD